MGDQELDTTSPDVSENQDELAEGQADAGAESSTTPDGDEKSFLDIVKDAVPADEEDDAASPAGENGSDDQDGQEQATSEQAEPDNENFSDVPFHKHPRFQQVLAERRRFQQGHEQFETLQTYLRENGLSSEDAAQALQVQAALKRDPRAAWDMLKPVVQDLLIRTGEVLSDDLRREVQAGTLSRERALEISRARAFQGSQQSRQQVEQGIQQSTQAANAAREMQQAAADWEIQKGRADPKYGDIAEDIQKEVLWLQRRDGMPKDAAGVRKMLDEAHGNVTKRTAPRRQKQQVTPVRGGRAAGGSRTEPPKSILEIVQRGG